MIRFINSSRVLAWLNAPVLCNLQAEDGSCTPITVTEYIIGDLKQDELAFHNPLHRKILKEAATHLGQPGFTAERFFLSHADPAISRLAADLVTGRYQLSRSQLERLTRNADRL